MPLNNFLLKDKFIDDGSRPEAVVLHLTDRLTKATSEDRMRYHLSIEQDSKIVYGHFSMKDNDDTTTVPFAAHSHTTHSHVVGVAMCGKGVIKSEYGIQTPVEMITHAQFETTCRVIAEICHRKRIAVGSGSVFLYGEQLDAVPLMPQTLDCCHFHFPWSPSLGWQAVIEHFRTRVLYYYHSYSEKRVEAMEDVANTSDLYERPLLGYFVVLANPGVKVRLFPLGRPDDTDILLHQSIVPVLYIKDGWAKLATRPGSQLDRWVPAEHLEKITGTFA